MSQLCQFKEADSINISYIGNKEYLLEISTDEAKFVSETSGYDPLLVDIKNGPQITVGKDFLGKGSIDKISILRTNPNLPLLLKVRVV